jgi:predicted nucleic acid-binding protein
MSTPGKALVLDASVVVKWFKKGEGLEEESLALRDRVLSAKVKALTSEWLLLEVARAMVKAGLPAGKVDEAYTILSEMDRLGFMEAVPVGEVLDVSKETIIGLHLYASDSVYLATSIIRGAKLVTEDRHLLRGDVVKYARLRGVEVHSLEKVIDI